MGYNFKKKSQQWKERIENAKMVKFEVPSIKELINTSVWIFGKFRVQLE